MPSKEYQKLSEDLFNTMIGNRFNTNVNTEIPVEVFNHEDEIIVHFHIVNVDKDTVDVSVKNGSILCVKFDRPCPSLKPSLTNLKYGNLECNVKLHSIKEESITAVHENNVLTVTISKSLPASKIVIQ